MTISSPDGPDVEVLAAAEGAEVAEGIPQVYLKVTCWKRSFVLLAIAPMRLATEALATDDFRPARLLTQ